MTILEPTDSVILRGHNCKIEIGGGNTISHMVITGHNNKVYSKQSNATQQGVIGQIEILGHNNRVENMIANSLKIGGHNNRFSSIHFSQMND